MSERIRSFIAVTVPPESAVQLSAAQEQLRAAGASVKWVKSDGFHITLKFLGGVERDRLSALWPSVAEALAGQSAFAMCFRGVGAFPTTGRPRVVWAGVTDGAEELSRLAAMVEEACGHHGFEAESRPFRPHLTLGRAREPRPSPALTAAMAALREAELGRVWVDRVILMRSDLTPEGAIYSEVDEVRLVGQGESG